MHIVLLTAEYPPQPGGVGDYTRCLADALTAIDTTITVLTSSNTPSPSTDTGSINIARTIRNWDWQCWQDTIAALDRLRPNVLHIQYQTGAYGMHPAINLLPWRLHPLPSRPKLVVTFHDLLEPYLLPKAGKLRRWITHRLAQDSDYTIVTNQDDAATLRTRLPHQPLSLIPIGSNIAVSPPTGYQRETWRARLGVRPDEMLIAYFGLLSRSKGVEVLLDAMTRLLQQNTTPYQLLLIGGEATAPQDRDFATEIATRLEQSPLQQHVIRTGHVESSSVSAHLLAADAMVLPFHSGASFRSGSLLAALSHGLPIITTTPSPLQSPSTLAENERLPQLTNEQHALLVPPGDAAALAHAIQRLANDAPLRASLGTHAQTLAVHFDWQEIAARHSACYASPYGRIKR